MSIHIQTAIGLIEVSGDVTQEKIISALGYLPVSPKQLEHIRDDESNKLQIADASGNIIMQVDYNGIKTTEVTANGVKLEKTLTEHITNNVRHITSEERATWDGKPDNYSELPGAPAIMDDEGDRLEITDPHGHIALRVDSEGTHSMDFCMGDLSTHKHITTESIHVTPADRTRWNLALDYNNLRNTPSIINEDEDTFYIADSSGNVIAKIDENGLKTTNIQAKAIILNDKDLGAWLEDIHEIQLGDFESLRSPVPTLKIENKILYLSGGRARSWFEVTMTGSGNPTTFTLESDTKGDVQYNLSNEKTPLTIKAKLKEPGYLISNDSDSITYNG